jgi:hypothetical protein
VTRLRLAPHIALSIAAFALSLVSQNASGQLREIDAKKLPSDTSIQATYAKLLPFERFAQNWSNEWHYDVPKSKVVELFSSSFGFLAAAVKANPENRELKILTGLVGHFAYNLDVEKAYQPTFDLLTNANATSSEDYRPDWFLGIHRCQAGEITPGMDRLLAVEARVPWQQLPIDFWNDGGNAIGFRTRVLEG